MRDRRSSRGRNRGARWASTVEAQQSRDVAQPRVVIAGASELTATTCVAGGDVELVAVGLAVKLARSAP